MLQVDFTSLIEDFGFNIWLVISVAMVILLFGFYYALVLNKKFPKVTFLVFDGNVSYFLDKRLMGRKIVDDNIISILLEGDRLIGENINDFESIYWEGKKRVYLAFAKNKILIPLRKQDENLDIEELGKAREIATRYVNTIDESHKQVDKQNPVMLTLLSVMPLAVIIILFGIMTYLIINSVSDKMMLIAQTNEKVSGNLKSLVEVFLSKSNTTNKNVPPIIIQNQTVPNKGLPAGG